MSRTKPKGPYRTIQGNMMDILLHIIPAVRVIFNLGFIPQPDEFFEFTAEQYASYVRKGGDPADKLYQIIPRNYKYLSPSGVVDTVKADEVERFQKAEDILWNLSITHQVLFSRDDRFLKAIAPKLPPSITDETPYQQPRLRVLKKEEENPDNKEKWSEFLADCFGSSTGVEFQMTVVMKDSDQVEHINLSIPKRKGLK